MIETCKLDGVNPLTYITDLLTRLINGWSQGRISELHLPHEEQPEAVNPLLLDFLDGWTGVPR